MILEFKGKKPVINDGVFIAPNATVIGDVILNDNSSIWFNAVLRGDDEQIIIGKNSNIQDGCILHGDFKTILGDNVSVGHGAILHGCTIGDGTLIGMGAIVLNNAKIGKNCLIGAGSLVGEGMVIPDGMLAIGNPAKIVKELSDAFKDRILHATHHYVECKEFYKDINEVK